jgi:hypothetical protein
MKLIAAAVTATAAAIGTFNATLSAPTHKPRINTKWYYVLRVAQDGRPVAARITAQIVDPIGGAHLVQLGSTTKAIKNYSIKGVFRDYIIWPRESRDLRLTLRITVRRDTTKKIVKYWVVPHS